MLLKRLQPQEEKHLYRTKGADWGKAASNKEQLQYLLDSATCRYNNELYGPEEADKVNPPLKPPKQAQARSSVSSVDNPFSAGKGENEKRTYTWTSVYGQLNKDQKKQWQNLTPAERAWINQYISDPTTAFKDLTLRDWLCKHPVHPGFQASTSGPPSSANKAPPSASKAYNYDGDFQYTTQHSQSHSSVGPSASYVSKDDVMDAVMPLVHSREKWIEHCNQLKQENNTLRAIAGAGDDKIMSIINNLPRVEPKEDDSDCIPEEYRFGNKKQKVR
jgi:hypothetical protein